MNGREYVELHCEIKIVEIYISAVKMFLSKCVNLAYTFVFSGVSIDSHFQFCFSDFYRVSWISQVL